ncbi:MAG: hypothetical protein ACO2O2_08970 [Acidilobaceae archaeon]|jgi:rRNA-processing protein FCF1
MEADRLGGCGSVIVVLDTSVVLDIAMGLIPLSSIGDVLSAGYKLVVPSGVLEELSRIAGGRGLKARVARRALSLIGEAGMVVYDVPGGADDAIVALALNLKGSCRVVVATNDRSLRRRLRGLGVPTMYYRRARGGLEVDWHPL